MELIDLKMTKKETKENMGCPEKMSEGPKYPYWSRFSIDTDQMDKFPELKKAKIGEKVTVKAIGEVVEIRKVDRQSDKDQFSVEIQMKKISIEPSGKNPLAGSLIEAINKSSKGKL